MEICNESQCSGCYACVNICPKKAIIMVENSLSEIHPEIDEEKCVSCGLCKKVCPQNCVPPRRTALKCYAAFSKNFADRMDSASGGIGTLLHRTFLTHDNAVGYSVRWDQNFNAVYCRNNDISNIDCFRGSKYVQSQMMDVPKQIESDLKKELTVLFIGLPCHVAGLLNFLNLRNIDCSELVTVDLLCHGVCPASYLHQEIEYMKSKSKLRTIQNITFRSNRKFRSFHICMDGTTAHGRSYCLNKYSDTDYYFRGFLQDGTTLRESCYHCKFAEPSRVADISIGDFIGLGKDPQYVPYESDQKNISVVLCNSEKGVRTYQSIIQHLNSVERFPEEAFQSCPALRKPYEKGIYRDEFIKRYAETSDFIKSAKMAYGDKIRESRIRLLPKELVISALTNVLRKY